MTTPSSLPATMRAIHQPNLTSTSLTLITLPIPTPSHPTDHLVKVAAACPTARELLWALSNPDLVGRFRIPTQEFAGTVVSAPPDSPFPPGTEVYALMDFDRPGAGSEYTLVRTHQLARKPETLDWIQAAAVPMSALTAWEALFVHGGLDPAGLRGNDDARKKNAEKKVIISGAGASVGLWAVQLASGAGVTSLTATASPSKASILRDRGASEVVDYTKTSLAAWAASSPSNQADVVLDCVGGSSLVNSWSAVRNGGVLLSIGGEPEAERPEELKEEKKDVRSLFFIVGRNGALLGEITELIDEGRVKLEPVVDSVVGLDEYETAFERVESGKTSGKVVITIQ